MKYENITVIGKRSYKTVFNGNEYSGLILYGTYKSDSIQGNGCVQFKIKERYIDRLGANNVQIGKIYNFITSQRSYEDGSRETIVEDIYTIR